MIHSGADFYTLIPGNVLTLTLKSCIALADCERLPFGRNSGHLWQFHFQREERLSLHCCRSGIEVFRFNEFLRQTRRGCQHGTRMSEGRMAASRWLGLFRLCASVMSVSKEVRLFASPDQR